MANYHTQPILTPDTIWTRKVVEAANSYLLPGRSIQSIANGLNVSRNQLTKLFCEAIAQRYITSDTSCVMIMNKHITEYEKTLNTTSESIRELYKSALEERCKNSDYIGLVPLPFTLS